MPKVSIVVAVYNAEKYLRQTLESLISQTMTDIELICVDDRSEDNSFEILKVYEEKDSRIRIFQSDIESDGAAYARNLGIKYAHGKYLIVLDADDFYEPHMLQRVVERAENTAADIVIFNAWEFYENTQTDIETGNIIRTEYIGDVDVFSPKDIAESLFEITIGAAWNCLFLREFIEHNDIHFQPYHHADDLGFVYLAFACAKRIALIHERLMHYRRNVPTSQASNVGRWPETCYNSLCSLKKELEKRNLFDTYAVTFAQKSVGYSLFYLNHMRNGIDFVQLYSALRDKYLPDFGAMTLPKEKFTNSHFAFMRDVIRDYSAEEYLFNRLYRKPPFQPSEMWSAWKKEIPQRSSVAIYGAGVYGTRIVTELFQSREFTVVAWVDQKHQELGYPILNPQVLKTIGYEYVVVAIISETVWKGVRQCLKEMEIPDNKIKWIGVENNDKGFGCHAMP